MDNFHSRTTPTNHGLLANMYCRPGYLLQKFPAGKWLGLNVALWGLCCAAGAGAFNYHSLMASRIFLGIFEAAIAPCLMLISSQYYNKKEQASRFSIWYSGLGVGQVLGGLISFAFQHVHNTHFKSWQAMFVFVGCSTGLIGIATFFILPDSPMKLSSSPMLRSRPSSSTSPKTRLVSTMPTSSGRTSGKLSSIFSSGS